MQRGRKVLNTNFCICCSIQWAVIFSKFENPKSPHHCQTQKNAEKLVIIVQMHTLSKHLRRVLQLLFMLCSFPVLCCQCCQYFRQTCHIARVVGILQFSQWLTCQSYCCFWPLQGLDGQTSVFGKPNISLQKELTDSCWVMSAMMYPIPKQSSTWLTYLSVLTSDNFHFHWQF